MKVVITNHAAERFAERKIPASEVEKAVKASFESGTFVRSKNETGRDAFTADWAVRSKRLRVVFSFDFGDKSFVVATAYWVK